jgi:hypothetical protein
MDEQQGSQNGGNKNLPYIIAGVVGLILIVWGLYAFNHQSNTVTNTNNQQAAQDTAISGDATSTPTSTPVSTTGKLSYSDAMKAYPERFQFNLCQGTPASIAVRINTPVMLDNRNPVAYTIKADTQTFRIAGYDYDVFYPKVLGNLVVDCNGKPSVTLNVEK